MFISSGDSSPSDLVLVEAAEAGDTGGDESEAVQCPPGTDDSHWVASVRQVAAAVHGLVDIPTLLAFIGTKVDTRTDAAKFKSQVRKQEREGVKILSSIFLMLYKIRCDPVHPFNSAVPGPYVPARVTRGALVAHRYTFAPPRCRTLQYSRTFIPFSVSLWNDLANPVLDGVGLAGFKSRANASLLA